MTKKDIVRLFSKKQALPKWQFNLIVFISLPFVIIKKPIYIYGLSKKLTASQASTKIT